MAHGDTGTDVGASWAVTMGLVRSARVAYVAAVADEREAARRWQTTCAPMLEAVKARNLALARWYRLMAAARAQVSPLAELAGEERSLDIWGEPVPTARGWTHAQRNGRAEVRR